jgi:pilus assembly protein Flp/PilA
VKKPQVSERARSLGFISQRGALLLDTVPNRAAQFRRRKVMRRQFYAFLRDETGATAIEYGLIAAGIAVAIITVTKGLGSKLNTTFTSIQGALK